MVAGGERREMIKSMVRMVLHHLTACPRQATGRGLQTLAAGPLREEILAHDLMERMS
jgi:hypothetical protein